MPSRVSYNISHKVLFVVLLGYCANYISAGAMSKYLALVPELVFNKLELWRMISFPLAVPRLESILLFAFSFYFIAPKIESIIHKKVFPIILILLTALQGIIMSLAFRDSSISFSGPDGISFFMIFLFAALSFGSKSMPAWFNAAKTSSMALLVSIVWVSVLIFQTTYQGTNILIGSAASAGFGIFTSIITYLNLKAGISSRRKAKMNELATPILIIPTPEELKYAMMSQAKRKQYHGVDENENLYPSPNNEFAPDEDRLNEILDKILESGQESLTVSEIKYLDEYSKNI